MRLVPTPAKRRDQIPARRAVGFNIRNDTTIPRRIRAPTCVRRSIERLSDHAPLPSARNREVRDVGEPPCRTTAISRATNRRHDRHWVERLAGALSPKRLQLWSPVPSGPPDNPRPRRVCCSAPQVEKRLPQPRRIAEHTRRKTTVFHEITESGGVIKSLPVAIQGKTGKNHW